MSRPAPRAAATPSPAFDLAAWRRRVPLLASVVPLNHCSQAPQVEATRTAAERYLESWNRRGMDWERWLEEVHRAKQAFATLIGAAVEDVAVTTSVSAAAASVASALDFGGRRRRVVASGAEFPTVGHVWLAQERHGAEVVWVPVRDGAVELADYEAAVDERTLVVSACHAAYQNGALQEVHTLAELAHERGALLFVDAYQTLGVVPVDAPGWGVDFLASGNLKYLLGVPGIAFLYVRRELIETLRPAVTGWFGRADPFAFRPDRLDWSPTAARFETGTPPIPAAYVARAGMEVLLEVGIDAVAAWTGHLSRRLLEGAAARGLEVLGPRDPRRKTPSTAIRCDDAHAVEAALRERRVLASARGPAIRLAPHFYNTVDDVDLALDALTALTDRG